ncbi:MAG: OmpA family protein [Pseudomonadota bacterium]
MRVAVPVLIALMAQPALAQPRPFNCIGAERLEDDVFTIGFAPGRTEVTASARSLLAAAADLAKADPDRNICVLGHAGAEGSARTSTTLAAQRARDVASALSALGVERDRIRAEARSANFSPVVRAEEPPSRTVSIVVLPAQRQTAPAPQ